jgi:hypothetical protein
MSHYCVGVIIPKDKLENEDILSEMLAPYDEAIEVEPYVYRTKEQIIKMCREYKEQYNSNPEKYDYLSHYKDCVTDEDLHKAYIEFHKKYEDEKFDEEGNELSTYNPDSKWDWWTIVGRFSHESYAVRVGEFKLYDEPTTDELNKYKDIWAWLHNDVEYDRDYVRENFGFHYDFYKKEYLLGMYKDFDSFVKDETSNLPYALLNEDGWFERSETGMGWFGCDDATVDSVVKYQQYVEEYFNNPDNADNVMVFVDCHI